MKRLLLLLTLLSAMPLVAQQSEVAYSENFDRYAAHDDPSAWLDAANRFEIAADPLVPGNVVYGARHPSQRQRSVARRTPADVPDLGAFATLAGRTFSSEESFEYRGRLFRATAESLVGITFFSTQPERRDMQLLGLWRGADELRPTMRLYRGNETLELVADSGFTPDPRRWYRFAVRADEENGATRIRARFWIDGEVEPQSWTLDVLQRDTPRAAGRIGLWSAVGAAYFDDLEVVAKSAEEIDTTAPAIVVTESGEALEEGEAFNRDARLDVRALDGSGIASLTITVNGAAYRTGDAIGEGRHELRASAVDTKGNRAEKTIAFIVDKSAPKLELATLLPITNGSITPAVKVSDLTATTIVLTLNGAPFTAGTVIDAEGTYAFEATAVDAVGWKSSGSATFIIDRTPPSLVFTEAEETIADAITRNRDAAVQIAATDANGIASLTATRNDAPYVPGAPIADEGTHALAATATDAAGNKTSRQIRVVIDKTKPVITITGVPPLTNAEVTPRIEVSEPATIAATLNDATYTSGTVVTSERAHTLVVEAVDAAGNRASSSASFVIDRTPPSVAFSESGETIAGSIARNRDVHVQIAATDAHGVKSVSATRNGDAYLPGAAIADEGTHVIAATATDEAGNTSNAARVTVLVDKTIPVITISDVPALTNAAGVTPRIEVSEPATITATLDSDAYAPGTTVTSEGAHALSVDAIDAAGNRATRPASFVIDRTPPEITFVTPSAEERLGNRQVAVTGRSGDAVRIVVNGVDATIDAAAKTFHATIELLEGTNDIVAIAFDAAGNSAPKALRVHLDTRAPELAVSSPAANACVSAQEVTLRGTVRDAARVLVRVGDTAVEATIAGSDWTAILPLPEGKIAVSVEATDAAGHAVSVTLPLLVDRTKPLLTISENGAAFEGTLFNRRVVPFVAASEDGATLTVTLNGTSFRGGSAVDAEQTHVLRATAVDCAGNRAELERTFTIDRTPPSIVTIEPAGGSEVGTKSPLAGTLSEAATLSVEESGVTARVDGTAFTIDVPLEEGLNELAFIAIDRAGNRARIPYALRVKSGAPVVEIVENGTRIAADALFNRALAPVIRVSDADATLTAMLNGQPFSSGTTIEADGTYTLSASAVDAFGHASATATATFTIDRTPPSIDIVEPADASAAAGESVIVRGSVSADAQSVAINGTPALLDGTSFTATVLLEEGTNVLTATATDRAGNTGRDHVEVRRGNGRLAIFLTSPPDDLLTNRATTVVAGQVLNPPASGEVRINGQALAVDASGMFRKTDFALAEGENEITASVAAASGAINEVTVGVTADFTPPTVGVTANGRPLADGARFAAAPRIEIAATDNRPAGLTTRLTVDGADVAAIPSLENGGHTLTAIARDAAGNETRVDRTFFVGDAVTLIGCALSDINPASGTALFGQTVRITGRSGGASSVLIDGNAAQVADGSFCGDATLQPGRNEVVIRCADASGNPTSDAPVTLVLWRDVEPSIAITSPANGASVVTNTISIAGTVSDGVTAGEVNGIPFTAANGAFVVDNVALSPGLNVITARAKSGAGRTAIATARVTLRNGTPQLAITSPLTGTETGAASIDVSGTYVNVDPSTIRAGATSATVVPLSDTHGTFAVNVPLAAGTRNTTAVSARNHASVDTTATVEVQQVAGRPSIAIAAPLDHAIVAATPIAVTGTFDAPAGAAVQVNGVAATISGNTFSATIDVPAAQTPIVARVVTAEGTSASDSVRVTRYAAPLAVRDTFPTANATGVDRGAALIVLFTRNVTRDVTLRLTSADGVTVGGETFVDRDAITFAPDAPLQANHAYTLTTSTGHTLRFTTAASAPATAPLVDDLPTSGCLSAITLTGRASVPGARVRLVADNVTLTTVAGESGAFSFTFSFSGQTGFHIARLRQVGEDGSLSAERAICFRLNCELPRVVGATLDRDARTLSIEFSRAMNPATLVASPSGTILIVPDGGTAVTGSVTMTGSTAVVAVTEDLADKRVALTVKKEVADAGGATLAADYTQLFDITDDGVERGKGSVSGAVYDATNGRPLANALITIGAATTRTNDRGRYARALAEGAWTIEATAEGFTSAWRQIVVPAGAGVVPIDIRLTRRGDAQTTTGSAMTLIHGGDTTVTKRVELALAAASLPPAHEVRLTAVGAQSLAGLLPLGWSPLASAEVAVDGALTAAMPAARLSFHIDAAAVRAANQTLTFVRYDSERDEWRVVEAVAAIADALAFDITAAGHYAVVYPDAAAHLERPPAPRSGGSLSGVLDRCASATCALTSRNFTIEPRAIVPSGRAVATLETEGAAQAYPSGTAVQATIDEQLNLADGRVVVDPPFATVLLVYRTLAGDAAVADFHLAPTATAAAVVLRDGVERIRIVDYPARVERGTLLGPEGGRIPGDDGITIDVPAGATFEPLHASATSMAASELASFGSIAGFRIAGGFTLALTRAGDASPGEENAQVAPPELVLPARATFALPPTTQQVIVARVLPQTAYGIAFELVAIAEAKSSVGSASLFTTRAIVSTELPIDGLTRDGRYLILVADAPIAFAYGTVRTTSVPVADAQVRTSHGVTSITRLGGLFVLPVPSKPAAPFTLTPRSAAIGDGATATASAAPERGAFVDFGVLPLAAQAPRLRSVTPADGAEHPIDAPFVARAEFDVAIDPASVSGGLTITNLGTGTALTGNVTAAGNVVSFDPREPLAPAARYAISIGGRIRALSGAPFGEVVVKSFTTSAIPRSTSFNRDRVRITIPDASGRSTIRGTAGAIPGGAQAIAVRRGRLFATAYQATAASDGSFTFDAGHLDPRDAIALADVIDLQVVDPVSRAVVAVIELTPFTRDDARAFVAQPHRVTSFTGADGITVTVPAGAFDTPTLIAVAPSEPAAFAAVPRFGSQLRYAAGVELQFDGVAQQRLDVSLPVPANTETAGREFLLGYLGASMRGPRVMVVDLVRVEANRFATGIASSSGSGARRIAANAAITGPELREHLLGVNRSGTYAVVDLHVPEAAVGWGVMSGLQAGYELFNDALESLYVSHLYLAEGRGRIAMPIVLGKPFRVVGVDAGTGLEAFAKVYDPIAIGDPGAASILPNANPDRIGPHPLFATPFRIEAMDVTVSDVALTSIDGFTVTLRNERIDVTTTLAGDVGVTLMNATRGIVDAIRADGLTVDGEEGDRIVLLVEQREVDPNASLSIVFDEPIDTANLESLFRIETAPAEAKQWMSIGGALRLRADSGGRRVVIETPASLIRGNRYRLVLSPQIRNTSGLRIGQTADENGNVSGGLTEPLYLELRVRTPGGVRAQFDLQNGVIRDQALNGNVLFIAAGEGGIAAYDVSNPAAMNASTAPLRVASGATDYWSVATDHHGRVFATGVTPLAGVFQSFRLEQFLPALTPELAEIKPFAGALVSFTPGASSGLGTSASLLSDRVEAYPRRMQLVVQDDEMPADGVDELKELHGVTLVASNGNLFDLDAARDHANPYARQRITIENTTLDLRWSADATMTAPARFRGVLARPGDQLRMLRNRTTYAVLALFGFGIAVHDVNAMESNDAPEKPPAYQPMREQVRLTNGRWPSWCNAPANAIPDLTFTPDATIVTRPDSTDLHVLALDSSRGVLDVTLHPPRNEEEGKLAPDRPLDCADRGPGLVFRNRTADLQVHDDPRLAQLRALFRQHANRDPFARFTGAARFHWSIEAADNRVVSAASDEQPALGQRGSVPHTRAERDYMLIAGYEYGLLVVEIGGDAPLLASSYRPLGAAHLVDVIWIPGGAYGVRTMPRGKLASVVDGHGRIVLVDLSRVDERWNANGPIAANALFPTAAAVLARSIDTPDPRIVWTSPEPLTRGTLAPVVDADTGFVYAGRVLEKTTSVVAAVDPRLQLKVDTGAVNGLSESGGLVPLGIAPPPSVALHGDNASLAAFRIEVALPGAMQQALGGAFELKIESERVAGAKTEETLAGWPRAHLDVTLQRVAGDDPKLRHQRGFNKWISPWIVAIADPRASESYVWPQNANREAEGCFACRRPSSLRGRNDVHELFTNGRLVSIRADAARFAGTGYDHLASGNRLSLRVPTVMADTVRPPSVLVAAQNAPVAGGAVQETTYLHSGEIETSSIDLDAGGRAGWNVLIDRTYRSRTIGTTTLGPGWDSTLFRRLRPLPNGDVEYRDGMGEIWLFRRTASGYVSPKGLFLQLTSTSAGWLLIDQQRRQVQFDGLGRLVAESDHLYDGRGGGNITRYLYDARGRLAVILDAVGRETRLAYDDGGRLREIADWRGRKVGYSYDQRGRLTRVALPEAKAGEEVPASFDQSGDRRPRIAYGYDGGSGDTFNDAVELKTNLATITEAAEVASGGAPRVTFAYSGDRVTNQTWATGETASLAYDAAAATTIDALGQKRVYTLTDPNADDQRVHIASIKEEGVPVLQFGATMPASASPSMTPSPRTLETTFSYDSNGNVEKVVLPNLLSITSAYEPAAHGAPGTVLAKVVEDGPSMSPRETRYTREPSSNLVEKVARAEGADAPQERETPQPTRTRRTTTVTDDEVAVVTTHDAAGRVATVVQKAKAGDAVATTAETRYYADAGVAITRGRPWYAMSGESEKSTFTYTLTADGGEKIEATDMVRGTTTEVTFDALGRKARELVRDSAGKLLADERFGYDASGRPAYHARRQSGLGIVETRMQYDAMGRAVETSTSHAAVDGAPATIKAVTEYDFANRTITHKDPTSGGTVPAETVTMLDALGRVTSVERRAGSQKIVQRYAYDAIGARTFDSDGVRVARIEQRDLLGRTTAVVMSDGTRATTAYTPWGEVADESSADAAGKIVSQKVNFFTSRGRLRSTNESTASGARKTHVQLLGGGKTTVIRTGEVDHLGVKDLAAGPHRALQIVRDDAGNVVEERIREVGPTFDPEATSDTWSMTRRTFVGGVPVEQVTSEPKAGASYVTTMAYDGMNRPVQQTDADAYTTTTAYDEASNVLSVTLPGMRAQTASYDARGLVTKQTLADGKTHEYRYDALGNVRERIDEAGESTFYDYDALGRPEKIRYADDTFEQTTYEPDTGAVKATRDRAGQWLSYAYDSAGRTVEIRGGEDIAAPLLVKYEYDAAGRLASVRNKDAGIAFAEYDPLGRPGITRNYRYLAGTGLEATPALLDVHTQRHTWSIFDGERARWSMPVAGATLPAADNDLTQWLQTIGETRDAGANLVLQKRGNGTMLTSAEPRAARRIASRRRHLGSDLSIATIYGFADGTPLPPSAELPPLVVGATMPSSGLPLWTSTSAGSARVAGSANVRDGARRIAALRELGTRRLSAWNYDDRGRVTETTLDAVSTLGAPAIHERYVDADFRAAREATPLLSAAQHALLGDDKAPEAIRVNGKYPGKQPIVYINGVLNDREDAISTAAEISVYYSAPGDAVWNPSSSFFLDIAQVAFVNKLNVPDVTTRTAVGYLRTRIAELPAGDHLEVIAHSQGAGVFSSAASFLTVEERSRINLVTWGGAAYMQPEGMASVRNVINILDVLVPWPVGKRLVTQIIVSATDWSSRLQGCTEVINDLAEVGSTHHTPSSDRADGTRATTAYTPWGEVADESSADAAGKIPRQPRRRQAGTDHKRRKFGRRRERGAIGEAVNRRDRRLGFKVGPARGEPACRTHGRVHVSWR